MSRSRLNSTIDLDTKGLNALDIQAGIGIHHVIEDVAKRNPGTVALIDSEQRSVTYSELTLAADRVASQLRSAGVRKGEMVAVSVGRTCEMAIGILGILKSGAAYVPLDPAYPKDRLEYILDDSNVSVLLVERNYADRFERKGRKVVILDSKNDIPSIELNGGPFENVESDDAAYVIYTSGTTGKPKGVIITHGNLLNYAATLPNALGLERGDRYLHTASISFSSSVRQLILPLSIGATVVVASSDKIKDQRRLFEFIATERVSVLDFVPSYWRSCVQSLAPNVIANSSVRVLLSASEPLKREVAERLLSMLGPNARMFNMYGQTETTGIVFVSPLSKEKAIETAVVPIGQPIENASAQILNADLSEVANGEIGELFVGGAGVGRGYLNRPEMTADRFMHDPFGAVENTGLYRTGDLARYLPSGEIEHLGRVDDQVKIRGFRVELGEIESVIAQYEDVREAVVQAVEDGEGDKRLVAFVVRATESKIEPAGLRSYLKKKLPEYMVPAAYVQLERMPLTPNGKIDRKALPVPERDRSGASEGYEAPRNETEVKLAEIWSEVLGVDNIGVHDNFFDLGGHSLLATQVHTRIRNLFEYDLPLSQLFNSSTIAQLAENIDARDLTAVRTAPSQIDVSDRAKGLPLSFAQERLWFLDKLEPNSAAYNIPIAMRIRGALDLDLFRQAFDQIVDRHEALRTTIETIGGDGFARISSELEFSLSEVDLSALPDEEKESKVVEMIEADAERPFDLGKGQLFRAQLVRLSADEHAMLVTMHHVISDGWSLAVFFEELTSAYEQLVRQQPVELPQLPIQYVDFAVWQRERLKGTLLDRELAYWKENLNGAQPLLELPTDRPRPAVQKHNGNSFRFTFSRELLEELNALSRSDGATLFMTLFSAFQALLYRHTNQPDAVIGTPIANRNYGEVENLVGFFANTLALRTDLSGNPTFRELLARVKAVCLEAYEHQDLPFEKIVEGLNPERSLSYNPLFQVLFGLHNTPPIGSCTSTLSLEPIPFKIRSSKFDLSVLLRESLNGLSGIVEFDTDLFDEETIVMLMDRFDVILHSIVDDPDQPILQIPVLTHTEETRIVLEWNATETWYPRDKCIHLLFDDQVERTPDAVAVEFDGEFLTYRELKDRSDHVARLLVDLGVGPDRLVGLCVERSFETVIGIFAILKAGGGYVPLDPAYPAERLSLMLTDSGASVVLSHKRLMEKLGLTDIKVVYLDEEISLNEAVVSKPLPTGTDPNAIAYINYTSGSTGVPKGVCIQHSSLLNYTQSVIDVIPKDRPLHFANVSTIAADLGNTCIFPPLVSGGCVHMVKYEVLTNPELFRNYSQKYSIDFLKIVPSHLSALLDGSDDASVLPNELLYVGGEALTWDVVERILRADRGCKIVNEYGPTETTVGSTTAVIDRVNDAEFITASIGRPIGNTCVYILNEHLQLAPTGVFGELYIGGAGLARGYLNRPELTAERFVKDPYSTKTDARIYKTGDLARFRNSGELEYLGRADDQVKIRGFRIELGEVTAVLAEHRDVRDVVVVARDDMVGGKGLVAYIVGESDIVNTDEIRLYLQTRLPDYMVPAAFVELDEIPLTPNGKIDRRSLPAPERDNAFGGNAFEAPRTETEEKLAQIWCSLLGLEKVGIRDSFFDLGGHSLLAIRMFSEIEETFKKSIPLATLFEAGTIEKLADIIGQSDWAEPEASLVPIQPNGDRIPFYCIHAVGGNVMFYRDLAKYLPDNQPFFGLQARRLAGRQVGHATIEEMAEYYVGEIVEHHPEGPYCLGGSSFGGLVAYEMACQLVQRGKEVGMLALFDTSTNEYKKNLRPGTTRFSVKAHTLLERFQLHKANLELLDLPGKTNYISQKIQKGAFAYRRAGTNFFKKAVRSLYARFKGKGSIPKKYIQLENQLLRAGKRFVPRPYAGKAILFRASIQPYGVVPDPLLGWGKLVDEIEVIEVAGHHTSIVAEPYVRGLAEQLDTCLARLIVNDDPKIVQNRAMDLEPTIQFSGVGSGIYD